MTWGQLRFILQTENPDVPLDLLDSYLNERYEQVLEATDWIGLKAHSTIQTQAAYQSGTDTVTATIGSAAVTGLGTTWTNAITGLRFYIPGDTVIYTVTYVSATGLTLDRPYEGNGSDAAGTVVSNAAYVLMQHLYTLPADCRSVVTVLDPLTALPMPSFTKDGLDASAGTRATVGYPQSWAEYDDSPETSPPVLHQIEFFPPPLQSRGFPLEYLRAAISFDGGNTSGTPLPFVSASVLLAGVRAQLSGNNPLKEAVFQRELDRLLLLEHTQRRVKTNLKMAPRFTRHRLARTARGQTWAWRGGIPGGPT